MWFSAGHRVPYKLTSTVITCGRRIRQHRDLPFQLNGNEPRDRHFSKDPNVRNISCEVHLTAIILIKCIDSPLLQVRCSYMIKLLHEIKRASAKPLPITVEIKECQCVQEMVYDNRRQSLISHVNWPLGGIYVEVLQGTSRVV